MNVFQFFKEKGIDTVDQEFYRQIEVWRSWYVSNVQKFHRYRVYRGNGGSVKCRRLSLGMAKMVCEDLADLLLNERTQITIDHKATQEFVEKVLKDNYWEDLGNEYQEWKAALGTAAYVVYVKDSQVDNDGRLTGGTVGINYVEAGNIFPTSWENKRVTECIFTFVKTYKRKRYILFQYHRLAPLQDTDKKQYVIENMVVEDTNGSGRELELEEWNQIPHFAGLAPQLETGSDQPMFVIDRLNIVNNVDADSSSPMGVALFSNAIDVLRKIDLEYDSYANEFSLGRKRIFVAPEFLSNVNGEPVFDPEDTVFYELPEDYFTKSGSKEAMREVNMELRVEEHSKAIQDDIKMLGKKCGFGTDRYVFENGQAKTATEVISENSDMYRSLQKHELILERVLLQLIQAIIHTGIQIGIPGLSEEAEILIHFDDSIIQDKEAERSQDRQDVAMGAMPLAEYRAKWYGETLEEAEKNLPAQDGGIIE